MIASTNYSSPVMVNGFSCHNCTEVDQAKKNIDPSNAAAGPFGLNSTKSTAAKTNKAPSIDPAALNQAAAEVAKNKGSNVQRAYGSTPLAGRFLQLSV